MRINSFHYFLNDFFTQTVLRIRLFFRDKIAIIVYLSAALCFFFLFRSLNIQAETKAGIPIGVINLDIENGEYTDYSLQLVEGLREVPAIYVYEDSFETLEEMLFDGYINSIFIIKKGYQDQIKKGVFKHLIGAYQGNDYVIPMIVSDVIAGKMMYQICLSKGLQVYRKIAAGINGKHTLEDYAAYADSIKYSDEFNFNFQITYVSGLKAADGKAVSNSLLYQQIIAGIAAMLFSFVILFVLVQTVFEKERGISKRKRLTLLNQTALVAGNLLSVLLLLSLLSAIFAGCFCYYTTSNVEFYKLFSTSLLYSLIMGIIFEIISRCLGHVLQYQLVGAFLIICFGVIGFCFMLEGILPVQTGMLKKVIPNCWFIEKITTFIL